MSSTDSLSNPRVSTKKQNTERRKPPFGPLPRQQGHVELITPRQPPWVASFFGNTSHFSTVITMLLASGMLALALLLIPSRPAEAIGTPKYYPPANNNINNLTTVLSGSGAPGIFTSSRTPDNDYGAYNWCNMPHVRKREYKTPPKTYKLEYVEIIQRHHKRTPYGSNTFFKENIKWDCDEAGPVYGSTTEKGIGRLQWQANHDPASPWTATIGPGFVNSTCQFPQITPEGLQDSITHGTDLRAVYFPLLHLSPNYDQSLFQFRVTNNPITSQIASALFLGLFPAATSRPRLPIPVQIQPSGIDTLEPTYPCPGADALRNSYTTGNQGQLWKSHLDATTALYKTLDAVSGIQNPDTGGWHVSFDHYYDNMSAKQCHGKSLPCSSNDTSLCVSQTDANTVYRLGNWEYAYNYRGAPLSAAYSALKFGGWMLELKSRLLQKTASGIQKSRVKYAHNVAHDGSVSALLGFLQIEQMVWPGMGAEVVFELYSAASGKKDTAYFVRVLWGGQPMVTSTPLGKLDVVPLATFLDYIDDMVGTGNDLVTTCRG